MTEIVGVRLGEIAVPRTSNNKFEGICTIQKKYEPSNVEMNFNFTSPKVR